MRRRLGALLVAALVAFPLGASQAEAKPVRTPTAPVVQKLSSYFSPETGGGSVTITGTGFSGATKVYFGDQATSFSPVSNSTIVAKVPAGKSGRVDVRVAVGTAISAISRADEFAYYQPSAGASVKVSLTVPGFMICLGGGSCIGVGAITSGFKTATGKVNCRVTNGDFVALGNMWEQGTDAAFNSGVRFSGSWVEVTCDGKTGRYPS